MENRNLPSLKQQWTGLTGQVKNAFEQPRINQLPDSDLPELRKLLMQLFALTGLRNENFPDKIQTDLLLNFLREDLGNFTISEILLAFKMAIKNELEIDANHYQAFSASYIARIMSAYTEIRTHHLKSIRASENALKLETKMEHTQAELEEIRKGYILECLVKPFRYFIRTGTLTFGITPPSIIYKTLVDDLKIIELSKEDKKRIYDIALERVEKYLGRTIENMDEYRKMQTLKDRVAKEGIKKAMEFEIKSHCYEITVKEYLTACRDKKIDFEKIITEKTGYEYAK